MTCRTFAVGEGIAGKVFETKEAIIVNAADKDERYLENRESNVESILCIPLVVADEAIGVINITNKIIDKGIFTTEDLELLNALGNQAAVAINNTSLYEMGHPIAERTLYPGTATCSWMRCSARQALRHRLTLAFAT